MKKLQCESYEVSEELAQRLRSLLADEFLAAEAYRLAIVAMKGNKQHRLEEIAEKNGEDELEDHFKNLYEWMQSKGIEVVTDRDEMAQITNGTILKFKDGMSTTEIVDQLILSEEEAIAVYEDTIPHTELDLNTMLCGFLKDEREHLKELVDCRDEMGGGDKSEEPKHKIYEDREMRRHKVVPNYEVYKVYWNIGGKRYDAGDLIQDAFPKLGKDEREMLKTGICNDCWNGLEEYDDEYAESCMCSERDLGNDEIMMYAVEPEKRKMVKELYDDVVRGSPDAYDELVELLGDKADDLQENLRWLKRDAEAEKHRAATISDWYARSARSGSNMGD